MLACRLLVEVLEPCMPVASRSSRLKQVSLQPLNNGSRSNSNSNSNMITITTTTTITAMGPGM